MPYPPESLITVTTTTGPGGIGGGGAALAGGVCGIRSDPDPVEPTEPADTGREPDERGRMPLVLTCPPPPPNTLDAVEVVGVVAPRVLKT